MNSGEPRRSTKVAPAGNAIAAGAVASVRRVMGLRAWAAVASRAMLASIMLLLPTAGLELGAAVAVRCCKNATLSSDSSQVAAFAPLLRGCNLQALSELLVSYASARIQDQSQRVSAGSATARRLRYHGAGTIE